MFIACFPPSRCAKPIWAETHLSKTIWALGKPEVQI